MEELSTEVGAFAAAPSPRARRTGTRRNRRMAGLALGATAMVLVSIAALPLLAGGAQKGVDGRELYARKCALCHGADLQGGAGPSLAHEGAQRSLDWITAQIRDPESHKKGSEMPSAADLHLNDSQVAALAKFLLQKK